MNQTPTQSNGFSSSENFLDEVWKHLWKVIRSNKYSAQCYNSRLNLLIDIDTKI